MELFVKKPKHMTVGLLLMMAALGCDSVELTIGVSPGASGMLEVTNANDTDWIDARLLVEAVEVCRKFEALQQGIALWIRWGHVAPSFNRGLAPERLVPCPTLSHQTPSPGLWRPHRPDTSCGDAGVVQYVSGTNVCSVIGGRM